MGSGPAARRHGGDHGGRRTRRALTRQLLIFSRRDVVTPEVLDLNALIAEMEGLLRQTIGDGIELVVALSQTSLVPPWTPARSSRSS